MQGPPGQRFRLKLKELRENLRRCNKEVFGDVERKKKSYLEDISRWDRKEEVEGLELDEMAVRKEAQKDLERVLEMEEIMWRQKSRVQWLKEGDKKMKFFHRMASARRALNHIHHLKIGGHMVDNMDLM